MLSRNLVAAGILGIVVSACSPTVSERAAEINEKNNNFCTEGVEDTDPCHQQTALDQFWPVIFPDMAAEMNSSHEVVHALAADTVNTVSE